MKNRSSIHGAKKAFLEHQHDTTIFFCFSIFLHVQRRTLYSKENKVKQIDATNRIKALLDAISEMMHVDDSRFFLKEVEFVLDSSTEGHVDVKITHTKIREACSQF